jgi:hypothetical protein
LITSPAAVHAQPPDQIEPDRPDVTNGTHIVDNGLIQVELGGIVTRSAPGAHEFGSPFTVRAGVADWLEVRVGGDGLLVRTEPDARASGFGNVQLGAKIRVWEEPGGIPVLSILPTVNLPTADAGRGLGSGDADYTIALLTGTDVGRRGHADLNYGIGSIGAGGGAPHFVQHTASMSASVTATPRWNPYAEAFVFSREEPRGRAAAAVDAGTIYVRSPKLAFDGGLQLGLTAAAPGFAAFAGVSLVVGDVRGGHGVHRRQPHAPRSPRRTARGRS